MNNLHQHIVTMVEEDRDHIVEFFSEFLRRRSPNPPGDTRAAFAHVANRLRAEALSFEELAAEPEIPNLYASFASPATGRHVMLNGHLDVFPTGPLEAWTKDPWGGEVSNGKVWGRGAADMKAGTTAAIFAYIYLARLREELAGRVSLTVVSDEETGGRLGTQFLFDTIPEKMRCDCVLSGEPSGVKSIRFGAKGYIQAKIAVRTRGAHASYPNMSKNAILIATDVIRSLDAVKHVRGNLAPEISQALSSPAAKAVIEETMGAGTTDVIPAITVNVGTIKGGAKVNMIPAECSFEIDVRLPMGVDPDAVRKRIESCVGEHPEARIVDVSVTPPDFCDPNSEIVRIIKATVRDLGHPDPVLLPSLAMSDCRYWRTRGIPAYWYGPAPAGVCAADEWVSIDDLLHIVKTHTLSAARFLMVGSGGAG